MFAPLLLEKLEVMPSSSLRLYRKTWTQKAADYCERCSIEPAQGRGCPAQSRDSQLASTLPRTALYVAKNHTRRPTESPLITFVSHKQTSITVSPLLPPPGRLPRCCHDVRVAGLCTNVVLCACGCGRSLRSIYTGGWRMPTMSTRPSRSTSTSSTCPGSIWPCNLV